MLDTNVRLLRFLSETSSHPVFLVKVISCGQLPTPGNGRKSTFAFTPGTKVQFDCDPGYVLVGERRRWCYDSGDWNWPELGTAECIPEAQYNTMQVSQFHEPEIKKNRYN